MSIISSILSSRTEKFIFSEISAGELKPVLDFSGGRYVSVYLKSMNVKYNRKGFDKLYGVVHSDLHIPTIKNPDYHKHVFCSPEKLKNIDPNNIHNVIIGTTCLAKSVPYSGGGISIEIGLFSVRGSDLAGPYISLLEKLSNYAAAGTLSQLGNFANLAKDSIQTMLGAKENVKLEIGLIHTFSKPVFSNFAILAVAPENIKLTGIKLGNGDRLLDEGGNEIKDIPYIVFSIEGSETHDSWFEIEILKKSYDFLMDEYISDDLERIQFAKEQLFRNIAFCTDLFPNDASRLAQILQEELKVREGVKFQSSSNTKNLPELKSYKLFN